MKYLIVNADDFGYTPGVNRAIVEASRAAGRGIITATSLLASGAAFDDAVEQARRVPALDIGGHLNLVEGRPLSPTHQVAGLVDAAGNFLGAQRLTLQLVTGRATREQIERECGAQVERLLAAGIQPSHLDTHQHTHLHPRMAAAVAGTARRYGIQWIRRPFDSLTGLGRYGHWKRRVLASGLSVLAGSFDKIVRASGLNCVDHFTGFVLTGRLTIASLRATLENLPDGATELMCHPGYADAALAGASTNLLDQRERELEALCDPATQDTLRTQGIQLKSFRELPATVAEQIVSAPVEASTATSPEEAAPRVK